MKFKKLSRIASMLLGVSFLATTMLAYQPVQACDSLDTPQSTIRKGAIGHRVGKGGTKETPAPTPAPRTPKPDRAQTPPEAPTTSAAPSGPNPNQIVIGLTVRARIRAHKTVKKSDAPEEMWPILRSYNEFIQKVNALGEDYKTFKDGAYSRLGNCTTYGGLKLIVVQLEKYLAALQQKTSQADQTPSTEEPSSEEVNCLR